MWGKIGGNEAAGSVEYQRARATADGKERRVGGLLPEASETKGV
ncbi:hypothetical protein ALC56_08363 [Trachymyrmex septentrionalis]|uniref:Uncharacterized protein n=1 Tax=Trachymyrmex septentrionalis TaxID=34720 RepID=A0A195F9M4_9HYME|nr:hypothetical protein ALC56_08363 [Trachymyrmex septentrionalis]